MAVVLCEVRGVEGEMTERKAFEAWARGEGRGRLDRGITYLDRDDSGRYYHTHVLAAEQAWQAAAARYSPVVEAARKVDEVVTLNVYCELCDADLGEQPHEDHCPFGPLRQALAALDGGK